MECFWLCKKSRKFRVSMMTRQVSRLTTPKVDDPILVRCTDV